MTTSTIVYLVLAAVLIIGFLVYQLVRAIERRVQRSMTSGGAIPAPTNTVNTSGPQVIVNVPADYAPLSTIPSAGGKQTQLTGEKALLWWTVYKETLAALRGASYADEDEVDSAVEAANSAVNKVYGS